MGRSLTDGKLTYVLRRSRMAIKGDLCSMDLTQVFQMLSLNQKEGRLVIDLEENRNLSVLFCRHGITLLPICDLNDEEILYYVIKRRNIAGGNLIEARKKYERPDKPLLEALKEVGLIKRSWLLPMLRERIQSQILDLFFMTSGKFEFREEPANKFLTGLDEDEIDAFLFQVGELIMEGSKRLDEWTAIREVVPSTDEVFYAIKTPDEKSLSGMPVEMTEVLMALNGVRSVKEVERITGLGTYTVCGYILDLLKNGHIAPVESQTLVNTAHSLFQSGRMEDALRLFHRLLALTNGDPDIHLKIALIYERMGEYLSAANHYKSLAEFHLSQGDVGQSYEYYQTALSLIPTDIDVLGRLIGLFLRYGERHQLETFDVVEGSRVLVQVYLEMEEVEKAMDLLHRLIKVSIDVHHNRNVLIQLYLRHGLSDEAVKELDKIGKVMLEEGNKADAVKIYRQILKLDPGRQDVASILDDIDEDRMQARIRKRRRLGLVRSSLYVSAFIGCFFYYGSMARRELRSIDVQHLTVNHDYDSARRLLQEFIDRFPFSTAAMDARTMLEAIKGQEQAYVKKLDIEEVKRANEEKKNLKVAKEAFRKARESLEKNDLVSALEHLQRANQFSIGHDEWRKSVDLERNLNQVNDYHAYAMDLKREAEAFLKAGKYQQSYDSFVRLYRKYPNSSSARNLRAPVLLESEPAGAIVKLDGRELNGLTPMIVQLPMDQITELSFIKEGYQPVNLSVRGDMQAGHMANLPRMADFVIETKVGLRSAPCIFENFFVVGGRGGRVLAVDLKRETVSWEEKFSGLNENTASPIMTSKGIFTGSVDPGLFRLDWKDGQKIWRLKTESFFPSRPVVVNDTVIAGDTEGTLWCIWTEKGNESWHRETGGAIRASPVHIDGVVFVGNENGHLLAYNAVDGKEVARAKLKGGIIVPPVISGDLLVVVTEAGMLYVLNRNTFQVKWTTVVDGLIRTPLVVDGERVYVTITDGRLVRFSLLNGKQDEERFQVECNLLGSPLVRPDGVYLGAMDGRFYVLERQSLRVRWSVEIGEAIQSSVVEWKGLVIVTTGNGEIRGFSMESRK